MNKVEFKYVKNNEEAKLAFAMGIIPKNSFVVTTEEWHLWFNGVNLSYESSKKWINKRFTR